MRVLSSNISSSYSFFFFVINRIMLDYISFIYIYIYRRERYISSIKTAKLLSNNYIFVCDILMSSMF